MTDFQRRVCITLAALAAYRLGVHIPMPGLDFERLVTVYADSAFSMSSGRSWADADWLTRFSIFSLGVIPYLAAAVLMRLASAISPRLRSLENRSEAGRQKVIRTTRLLAVLIAGIQAFGIANGLEIWGEVVIDPGPVFRLGAAASMTAGFVAVMWISDQIARRGIGNGVALILFADIVTGLPGVFASALELTDTRAITLGLAVSLLLLSVAVVTGIVFVERTVRHVWVRYPNQSSGARTFGGRFASIPLKLNNGGFIPALIAGWLLAHLHGLAILAMFGQEGYQIEGWVTWGWYGHPVHMAASAVLIFAMAHIYAAALLDPGDMARRLQERGAVLTGTPPGPDTERAIRRLIRGLSFFGGVYLAAVYLLPEALYIANPVLPGHIGGIGFLIATAVAMDTLADLAHRWKRDYGEPIGEEFADAIAVATEIPDQRRIGEREVSEAGR